MLSALVLTGNRVQSEESVFQGGRGVGGGGGGRLVEVNLPGVPEL